MLIRILVSSLTSLLSVVALAQEPPADGETKARLREALANKKFEETGVITDAKLKAEEGSLSRYSLKFNLSYYGPVLSDLSAADQPNPDGSVGVYATSLGGSVSARYRVSPTRTISMGTGIKAIHPFHGVERFDMNNPYLSYDMSSRIGNLQMRNSPGVSLITVPNYTKIGEYAGLNFDNSLVYNIGSSGFAVGNETSFGYYLYNRPYERRDGKAARSNLTLAPFLKYNFSDRFSMNTSVGISVWNPRQSPDQWALWNRSVTQRLGVGYGISRDIYFAPYLSFYPQRLATDTTTFNFATIFSIL